MAAGEFKQTTLNIVRQRCTPVVDDACPQDMAAEYTALFGIEISFGDGGVGENFPAAFVIEVADHGRYDAVLFKEFPHAVEWFTQLCFGFDEVARFIVAVHNVDAIVFVVDFSVFDAKFGRVGVGNAEAEFLGSGSER